MPQEMNEMPGVAADARHEEMTSYPQIALEHYREAILIREVEQAFLGLFAQGKIDGTVHTCVGQEFSAIANAGALTPGDFVTSNHRCHGHFISFTKDWRGLMAELLGKKEGVCAGIGSSQHLYKNNFFSNGVQGGLLPVACGFALAARLRRRNAVVMSFIGDGTLGEGALYESMNMAALWRLPLVIVCENNRYAQSTPQALALAGDVGARARAFGMQVLHSNTWELPALFDNARRAIAHARSGHGPAFHLVDTYRLNAHSKGDDTRDPSEVERFRSIDPIDEYARVEPERYRGLRESARAAIDVHIDHCSRGACLSANEYLHDTRTPRFETSWSQAEPLDRRQVHLLAEFFDATLAADPHAVFIGEDVLSPYGGAFKVARGLSEKHQAQVITTPISEAGIAGLGVGLSVCGFKPYVEIMFGDFMTLAFDQIVNNASKFFHMYNRQVCCPVVLRTPMGGRRGYGPTHSQTLDKFFVGIDNVKVVALNTLVDPREVYAQVHAESHPVVMIENKTDYGKKIGADIPRDFVCLRSHHRYPLAWVRHRCGRRDVTIVSYGGMSNEVLRCLEEIQARLGVAPELFVLTQLSPLDLDPIASSVEETGRLVTIEEGSAFGGIGGEIVASLSERLPGGFRSLRIAAEPAPIPSIRALEERMLPSRQGILRKLEDFLAGDRQNAAALVDTI